MPKPILYYIYDPMCSWCWGYRPTWLLLQKKLESVVQVNTMVGGLAEDSNVPMPEKTQHFLQQTWHKISEELGTQFNFDFWSKCQPKRSTYPSCRAAIFARQYQKEQAMCLAIQEAYYLHAQNPSEVGTLIKLATSIGLDGDLFAQQINSDKLKQQLVNEIAKVRAMPIQGFPSLVLAVDGELIPIRLDYKNWQTSYDMILTMIHHKS
ncbi:DsbA family protein [Candidatus Colwellia aromaticivorans]|uniref:DsbA family protein n=1 Tax=Candidatus Colwellia aromaticivorans TaxID=2267621 RepID=UPI000DF3BF9E|nr:DsbA family protein [Candidatus Colwellia aromaticivorans]